MAGVTVPPWSIPYPTGTDRVADGDNAMQAIADRLTALLAQTVLALPVVTQTITPQNGWGGTTAFAVRNGWVQVTVANTKSSWAANEVIATVPAAARPVAAQYATGMVSNTGALIPVLVQAGGSVLVALGVSNGGGVNASINYPLGV